MPATDAVSVTVTRDVQFASPRDHPLSLDVYDGPATSGPKPAAILVRGGGFVHGDKGEFARHALDLAEDGYLVVEPQYRLAPAWPFPAALLDVKTAIKWVRAEAASWGADPERVVAVGHSAGANLVAEAAATADDPALDPDLYPGASAALDAVVGYAGVYDFRAFERLDAQEAPDPHADYLGGDPTDVPEAYDLASPVAQADVSMPPTLLLHGADDEVVPPRQSELMAAALESLTAVDHEVLAGGHTFPFNGALYDDVYERTVTFLDAQVGLSGGTATEYRRDPDR